MSCCVSSTRESLASRSRLCWYEPVSALPIVIGHRGASGYVPEHTLASYFLAMQHGADYVEPDLVMTADGVLAMEAPLLATLAGHGYEGREAPVWLQSFEVGNLRALAGVTQLKRVQLIEEGGAPYDFIAAGDARGYADLIAPAGLEEIAGYAQAIGPNKSLVIPRRADGSLGAPTALIADAHGAGLAVHPWTFRAENAFLPAPLRRGAQPTARGDLAAEIVAYLRCGIDGFFKIGRAHV